MVTVATARVKKRGGEEDNVLWMEIAVRLLLPHIELLSYDLKFCIVFCV